MPIGYKSKEIPVSVKVAPDLLTRVFTLSAHELFAEVIAEWIDNRDSLVFACRRNYRWVRREKSMNYYNLSVCVIGAYENPQHCISLGDLLYKEWPGSSQYLKLLIPGQIKAEVISSDSSFPPWHSSLKFQTFKRKPITLTVAERSQPEHLDHYWELIG